MPKIFEEEVYLFFFYSNEHRPIHVHVRYGTGEAVFNIEPFVELRESQGLKVRELSKAEDLANLHRKLIIEKWHERLGWYSPVRDLSRRRDCRLNEQRHGASLSYLRESTALARNA